MRRFVYSSAIAGLEINRVGIRARQADGSFVTLDDAHKFFPWRTWLYQHGKGLSLPMIVWLQVRRWSWLVPRWALALLVLAPLAFIASLLGSFATVYTTTGKGWSVDKWNEDVQTLPNKLGWGTGAGTSNVADTTLFTEDSGGAPAYARVTMVLTKPSAAKLRMVATLISNADGKLVTNAGVFDAGSGPKLLLKTDHATIPSDNLDSVEYTFELEQA